MSEIKVMLFGASRSGKTSILASMLEGCRENLSRYRLQLRAENEDASFTNATGSMMDFCDTKSPRPRMTTLRGDNEIKKYRFRLSYLDAPTAGRNTIVICDVPGEIYTKEDCEKNEALEKEFQESQIVIVAVDTPALLWTGNAGQHYQKLISCNCELSSLVCHLGTAIDEKRKDGNKCLKSIIFAPIKCEKYLHQDADKFKRDIRAAIECVYKEVLDQVKPLRYKVSIIPMETIGGVHFHHYSEADAMKVLVFNPKSNDDVSFDKYEEITALESPTVAEFIPNVMLSRCEMLDDHTVILARSGKAYQLKEGDFLIPTSKMAEYPYVYSEGKTIPYIWYKSNGQGFCQKNCEKALYEVIKLVVQEITASSKLDINRLINWDLGFWETIKLFLLGMLDDTRQLQQLCKALKAMSQKHEFDEAIELSNNIDSDFSTGLKIRLE